LEKSQAGLGLSRPIQELVNGLDAVKPISGPFCCADVADGVTVKNTFAHLVDEGFGVFQADEATELTRVNPCVALLDCSMLLLELEVLDQHLLDAGNAIGDLVEGEGAGRIHSVCSGLVRPYHQSSELDAGQGFLNPVGFDPALVDGLMGAQAVTHESCPELGGDAAIHEAEGIGVTQVVGTDGDAVSIERIEKGLGDGASLLCRALQVVETEGVHPAAGAGSDAAGPGFGGIADLNPVIGEPLEGGALVGTEAVGGAHAPGPSPVGEADAGPGRFDCSVVGDVTFGETLDAVPPTGGQERFGVEGQGLCHLGDQIALVASAGATGGHRTDDAQEDGLGDGAGDGQLVEGGAPFFRPGDGATFGVAGVLGGMETLRSGAEIGHGQHALGGGGGGGVPGGPGEGAGAELVAELDGLALGLGEGGVVRGESQGNALAAGWTGPLAVHQGRAEDEAGLAAFHGTPVVALLQAGVEVGERGVDGHGGGPEGGPILASAWVWLDRPRVETEKPPPVGSGSVTGISGFDWIGATGFEPATPTTPKCLVKAQIACGYLGAGLGLREGGPQVDRPRLWKVVR